MATDPAYPLKCTDDKNDFFGIIVDCTVDPDTLNNEVCWKTQNTGEFNYRGVFRLPASKNSDLLNSV